MRRVVVISIVATCLVVAYKSGVVEHFKPDELRRNLATLGPWEPLAFMGVYALSVVLAIAAWPIAIMGGLLFGTVWGTVFSVLGATLGASLAFGIMRGLGRDAARKRFSGRIKAFDEKLTEKGFPYMLFVRLVPIFPFIWVSYGAGLSGVSFRSFLLATFLGIIPTTFVYTFMGASADQVSLLKIGLIGAGFALLIGVPAAIQWLMARKTA